VPRSRAALVIERERALPSSESAGIPCVCVPDTDNRGSNLLRHMPVNSPLQFAAYSTVLTAASCLSGPAAAAVAGVTGGLVANAWERMLPELAEKLERGDAVLANHDLTRASGRALAAVLTLLSDAKEFRGDLRGKLRKMAKASDERWSELSTREEGQALGEARALEIVADEVVLDVETWSGVLRLLERNAEDPEVDGNGRIRLFDDETLTRLAGEVRIVYPRALREVLKRDFAQSGEAFAGLILEAIASLRTQAEPGPLRDELDAVAEELKAHAGERIERLWRDLDTGFAEMTLRFRSVETSLGDLKQGQDKILNEILNELRGNRPQQLGTPAVPPQTIPYLGTSAFVGRDEELDRIHATLAAQDRPVAISALAGMGGVGKTELAVQYARRHLTDYPGGICWLNLRGGSLATAVASFFAETLQREVPQQSARGEPLSAGQQAQWCWSHWGFEGRVLVVLDDVPGAIDLREALPTLEQYGVLLTTRVRRLDASFAEIPLDVLELDPARELLRQTLGKPAWGVGEEETAGEVCQRVGCLPLAVELIGRYAGDDPDLRLEDILAELAERGANAPAVDRSEEAAAMTAERGVRAAFELSWGRFAPATQEVGRLLGLFAPALVDWELVERVAADLGWGESDVLAAKKELVRLSFVRPIEGQRKCYGIHPLTREFLRSQRDESAEAEIMVGSFVKEMVAIAKEMPDTPTLLQVRGFARVELQVQEVAEKWSDRLGEKDLAWPYAALGRYYEGQGLYAQAEPWVEACRAAVRESLGEEHPDYAVSLNNLAELYRAQGRYEEALPLYERALELYGRVLGEEHPDYATSLSNLASLYESQGRYEEALPLYERSLELIGRVQGEEHPDCAVSLNDLAGLYSSQGRYEEALPLYEEALELRRRVLGGEHPDYALSLNNLAGLYLSQGRYEEALPLYEKALELRRRVLGEEHPDHAVSLNNLAGLYRAQGRYEEALPLYERSLEILERVLGAEHPNTQVVRENLTRMRSREE